ncbi:MAG: SRPBCC family protein [Planctomycetota bacterium]
MKKFLIGCGVLVLLLVVGLVVLGFVLPTEWSLERTVVINAPPAEVHTQLIDLRTWEDWSAWNREADPTCEWDYTGEPGTGMSMEWQGDTHGHGRMTITSADPASGFTYDLEFLDFDSTATGNFSYAPEGSGTKVTWYTEGDMDMFMGGLLAMALMPALEVAFDDGLAKLKTRVEGGS